MNTFFRILLLLLTVFSTDICAQPVRKPLLTRKGTFYTAHILGASYCRVGGLDGRERKTYIDDLVADFMEKGVDAGGGMYPRMGVVPGGQGGYFFTHRFAFGGEFVYSQKGYKEELFFTYTDSSYSSKIKVRVDYIDCSLGILYQTDFKISVFLGGGVGLNINDRVINRYKVAGKDTAIEKNERVFVNQYFQDNRRLYLPQYTWGITYYMKKHWGLTLRVQKTANFFSISSQHTQNFLVFQVALVRKYL